MTHRAQGNATQRLVLVLGQMTLHPDKGEVIRTAPELEADVGVGEDQIRERLYIYAKKMLGRVLGKIPPNADAQGTNR